MPLLHGKQLQNSSVILNKLSGTGSLVLNTGATFQVPSANINVATDVVNKEYVDSVAAGLGLKQSVITSTIATQSIAAYVAAGSGVGKTLTGATFGSLGTIGGYSGLTAGDRLLVKNEGSPTYSSTHNGIYVVTNPGGPAANYVLTRATDFDGSPSNEVRAGAYTFVSNGSEAGHGWVVVQSGTAAYITVDTDNIQFTQFSDSTAITAGDGIIQTGNIFDLDIASGSGLTFSATQLTINPLIGGNGLAWTSGVLSVNTANGLTIIGDNVQLSQTVAGAGLTYNAGVVDVNAGTGITISGDAVTIANTGVVAGSYGAANSVNTFTVNAQGQLTTTGTNSISIVTGQITNFTASVQSLASTVTAGTGITVSTSGGNATVSIANTGVAAGSYGSANSINTFTVNAQGQLTTASTQSISITSGQVTNFTASAISSALASGNFIDSNTIDFTANGATVSAIIVAGSLTASHLNSNGATAGYILSVNANGTFNWITNDVGDITDVTAGVGLTGGGSSGAITLTVRATNGVNADAVSDSVELGGNLTKDTTISGVSNTYDLNITELQSGQMSIDANTGFFLDRTGGVDTIRILATASSNTNRINIDAASGVSAVLDLNPSGGRTEINNIWIAPNDTTPTTGQALIYDGTKFAPGTLTGDITGVTAGIGLTGGGASGYVTLDVRATNGLTADATSDSVQLGGSLIKDTLITNASNIFTMSSANNIYFDTNDGFGGASTRIKVYDASNNESTTRITAASTVNKSADIGTSTEANVTTTTTNVRLEVKPDAITSNTIKLYTAGQSIGDGSSNNTMIIDDQILNKGLVYSGDYTANFTTYSLITKAYVDAIANGLGDITGVTAGDGLSGGGASGFVTLNVNTGTGLTISSDAVIIANTTVTAAAYGSATNIPTFTVNAQGQLTTAADLAIAIPSSQVTNFTSSVTTIVGSPVYSQRNQTPAATTGNGASSTLTISSTPNDYEHVSVYVNGQLQFLGNGTTASVDCYFGTQASTAIAIANVTSGNTLFWNGTYVGFDLAATDKVDFIYNA